MGNHASNDPANQMFIASNMDQIQSQHQHMLALMECTVCMDTYNSLNRKPMSLPCGHSICLECSTRLYTNGKIVCPFDKKEHYYRNKEQIATNFQMLSTLPMMEQLQAQMKMAQQQQPQRQQSSAQKQRQEEKLEYKSKLFDNGEQYVGYFLNGKMHGEGTLIQSRGGKSYEGQFKNGKKHGKGIMKCPCCNSSYDGEWVEDKMEGQGTYFFKNGDRYVGAWKNNNMHGYGTYYNHCGCKYEGPFKNDKKSGQGTWIKCTGDRKEGYWENDVRKYWLDELLYGSEPE